MIDNGSVRPLGRGKFPVGSTEPASGRASSLSPSRVDSGGPEVRRPGRAATGRARPMAIRLLAAAPPGQRTVRATPDDRRGRIPGSNEDTTPCRGPWQPRRIGGTIGLPHFLPVCDGAATDVGGPLSERRARRRGDGLGRGVPPGARRGEPVLLVEQFALGHDRGSSHGSARITRHSYADPAYARLMPAAFDAWRGLEADAGETLYLRTGGVSFGPAEVVYVDRVASSLDRTPRPAPADVGGGVERRPPGVPAAERPRRRLRARRRDAQGGTGAGGRGGAGPPARADDTRSSRRTPVRRVDLDAARPTLVTDDGTIEADRLIVDRRAPGRRG